MNRKASSAITLVFISAVTAIFSSMLIYNSSFRFSDTTRKECGYRGDSSEQKNARLKPEKVTKIQMDAQNTIAMYQEQYGNEYAVVLKRDIKQYRRHRGSDSYIKQLDHELHTSEKRGYFSKESSTDGKMLQRELLYSAVERKHVVDDMVANYKNEFGKDYAKVLKSDIDEFKEARGINEFRRRFGDDLYTYEAYKASDESKSKPSIAEKWKIGR